MTPTAVAIGDSALGPGLNPALKDEAFGPASTAPGGRLAALAQRLAVLWPGLQLQAVEALGSTNTALLERARAGDTRPCLLVAQRQTAGRGRLGRSWWSETAGRAPTAGPDSLTFSLGLPLAPRAAGHVGDWSGLSLAVGVALAEALGPTVRLKWPNDLWLMTNEAVDAHSPGRKLGGVLIETVIPGGPASDAAPASDTPRQTVIGVGLNLAPPRAEAGIAQPVAGWREVEPQATAAGVLERVAPALLQAMRCFEQDGFAAFGARFAALDALAGRAVRLLGPQGSTAPQDPAWQGTAMGVDERGALRLMTPAGVRLIDSGEVDRDDRAATTASPANLSVRPC